MRQTGGTALGETSTRSRPALAGDLQRLKGRQNAQLFAVFVDDADFARANSIVDADKGLCRTFVECDGAPPRVVAARLRGLPESPRVHERTLSIALTRIRRMSTLRRCELVAGLRNHCMVEPQSVSSTPSAFGPMPAREPAGWLAGGPQSPSGRKFSVSAGGSGPAPANSAGVCSVMASSCRP